jgi:hypothetical protein
MSAFAAIADMLPRRWQRVCGSVRSFGKTERFDVFFKSRHVIRMEGGGKTTKGEVWIQFQHALGGPLSLVHQSRFGIIAGQKQSDPEITMLQTDSFPP